MANSGLLDVTLPTDVPSERMFSPKGLPLGSRARLELVDNDVHLYYGIKQSFEPNVVLNDLEYDYNNLLDYAVAFSVGNVEEAEERSYKFWSEPVVMKPAVEVARDEEEIVYEKQKEESVFVNKLTRQDFTVVNPARGTCVRLAKSGYADLPVAMTAGITDKYYNEVKEIAQRSGYRGKIEQRDPSLEEFLYVGSSLYKPDEYNFFGFEFNPYSTVMHDNKLISVTARENRDVVCTYVQKDYTRIAKRPYDVSYYRLDMSIFYKMMVGTRLRIRFSEYMLHDNFVFKGRREIYDACHSQGGGKLLREPPPYLVAEMLYYDFGCAVNVTIDNRVYQLILDSNGKSVDLMGTPFVYSTRRMMIREVLRRDVGEVREDIDGMDSPVMVNEVSCNGYFITDEQIKRYTLIEFYYDNRGVVNKVVCKGERIYTFNRNDIRREMSPGGVLGSLGVPALTEVRRQSKWDKKRKRSLIYINREAFEDSFVDVRDGLLKYWYVDERGPYRYKEMEIRGNYETGVHPRKKRGERYIALVPAGYGVFGVSAIHVTLEEALAVRPIKVQEDRYIYQTIYSREAYDKERKNTSALHYMPSTEEVFVKGRKFEDDL